jgi:hypothetical protein
MNPTTMAPGDPGVTVSDLRPLLGRQVRVETDARTFAATLLSCVRTSAWFVAGDADVVVHLDELRAVRAV